MALPTLPGTRCQFPASVPLLCCGEPSSTWLPPFSSKSNESTVSVHTPPMQLWFIAQTLPHAPQLRLSEASFASHPLPWFPSQSPKPALHAKEQAPFTHAATAFCPPPRHGLPHAPQLLMSTASWASHPLLALL